MQAKNIPANRTYHPNKKIIQAPSCDVYDEMLSTLKNIKAQGFPKRPSSNQKLYKDK